MKATKDIKSVWNLENGNTIIGCNYNWKTGKAYAFFVQTTGRIVEYTKEEMKEIYHLESDDFANIDHNQF